MWEYYWHLYYSPILLRALSVVLGILSLFSFLGVISTMTGVSNSSSVYFQAVHRGTPSFSGVLIFILVTMGYAVYVTLWALFQMQFAGMMHLVPHRTSAVCLSFNARMCARLAAPMAFFYLGESTPLFCFASSDSSPCLRSNDSLRIELLREWWTRSPDKAACVNTLPHLVAHETCPIPTSVQLKRAP